MCCSRRCLLAPTPRTLASCACLSLIPAAAVHGANQPRPPLRAPLWLQALAAFALAAPALVAANHNGPYEIEGTDILNFALNLECLEAEFYSWAVYGEGLSEELRGGGPPSVGGMKANLTYLSEVHPAASASFCWLHRFVIAAPEISWLHARGQRCRMHQ